MGLVISENTFSADASELADAGREARGGGRAASGGGTNAGSSRRSRNTTVGSSSTASRRTSHHPTRSWSCMADDEMAGAEESGSNAADGEEGDADAMNI